MSNFTLRDLEKRLQERAQASADVSYTRKLLDRGVSHCAKKFAEEIVPFTTIMKVTDKATGATHEQEVTLDQVPQAARDTFSRESGGAPMGTVKREREKGKTERFHGVDLEGECGFCGRHLPRVARIFGSWRLILATALAGRPMKLHVRAPRLAMALVRTAFWQLKPP